MAGQQRVDDMGTALDINEDVVVVEIERPREPRWILE
jgi:hypothetical protein